MLIKVSYAYDEFLEKPEDETFEAAGMRVDNGVLSIQLEGKVVMIANGVWMRAEIIEVKALEAEASA